MKMKTVKVVSGAMLLSGFLSSSLVLASSSADLTKSLASSSITELPAKAAGLVANAAPAERNGVAMEVVRAAVQMNPASVVAIVSAVAHENPANASSAALAASTLQPNRIGLITKAAAAAAPAQTARIVAALIKQFPKEYGVISSAAVAGAPLASREVLTVVGANIPALRPSIQASLARSSDLSVLPVQSILTESYNQAIAAGAVISLQVGAAQVGASVGASPQPVAYVPASSASLPTIAGPSDSGPVLGPPFTGSTSSPTTYTSSDTTTESSGGRGYASP